MMGRNRRTAWAGIAALWLIGGCHEVGTKPKVHSSSTLLETGPQVKLSRHQQADVQVSIGRTCETQGRFDEAQTAYLDALKKDPRRADAEARLAILADRKGDATGADQHFARALKLKPKDPEILCDRGYSLYLRRQWSDAEDHLKKALAVDPSHPRSHANYALVLARQGDAPAALVEFAWAGCDQADSRANLALIMALEGHFEESRREYALALAAKPNSAPAREGLKAATVALAGRTSAPPAIARAGKAAPTIVDPALVRTSMTSKP